MDNKKYIGSGKAHNQFDSITVTVDLAKASDAMFTTENGTYLRFVVTKRQQADQYGKTHACFFIPRTHDEAPEPAPEKKKRRQKKDHLSPSA